VQRKGTILSRQYRIGDIKLQGPAVSWPFVASFHFQENPMSSSFGTLFRITTFGESHCKAVGVVIDGCPPGLGLVEADIQTQLDRRRPGQSALSTDRQEEDQVVILSGTEHGRTLGTPIALQVANKDQRPKDYGNMRDIPRPSHADYTYQMKYGIRASSGGGRSSARETIGTVAAGAVAAKILAEKFAVDIVAWVASVGEIVAGPVDSEKITREEVDATPIRCPDREAARRMVELVTELKAQGDSVGGTVCCVIRQVPVGLGEPVFEKLEAKLAQAMLAIPATKGFEFGSGFAGATMRGSQHNDPFVMKGDRLGTSSNRSGGIQGGISNGAPIDFRLAFKPTASIARAQETVNTSGENILLETHGRHDPCVLPRAVPIVEAMATLVVADMVLVGRG
jgi:chorismate synthase